MKMWIILFVLVASTSAVKVRRIDGVSTAEDTFPTNNADKLKDLREKLVGTGFMGPNNKTHDWRVSTAKDTLELSLEKMIKVADFVEENGEPIKFTNTLNKKESLKIRIGDDTSKSITLDMDKKIKAVREQLNEKGYLGSATERCVKFKFRLSETEVVNDEAALTVAQYLQNTGKDQIELIDYYKQGKVVELWVYKGLDKLSVPNLPLSMNLYDFRMVLSGNGTCHGKQYNYLSDEWVTLKKTVDLSTAAAGSPEFQISPDLVFSVPEEYATVVGDAHFVSDSGKDSIECVSKNRKGNIIGEIVDKYIKEVPTKVSMRIYKNTYCASKCNEGVTLDPVMLDHVQATNTEIWSTAKVVVSEQGTAIGFEIDTQPKTPFWIVIKHGVTDEVIVETRGDHGIQSYWNKGSQNIVVESYVIEKKEDLMKPKYMPTYLVQIYSLLQDGQPFGLQSRGSVITLPDESHNDGSLKGEGNAHTGSGTDAGFGPGPLITEFQFTLLTFKTSEIAQEIMGRAVNRRKRTDM